MLGLRKLLIADFLAGFLGLIASDSIREEITAGSGIGPAAQIQRPFKKQSQDVPLMPLS